VGTTTTPSTAPRRAAGSTPAAAIGPTAIGPAASGTAPTAPASRRTAASSAPPPDLRNPRPPRRLLLPSSEEGSAGRPRQQATGAGNRRRQQAHRCASAGKQRIQVSFLSNSFEFVDRLTWRQTRFGPGTPTSRPPAAASRPLRRHERLRRRTVRSPSPDDGTKASVGHTKPVSDDDGIIHTPTVMQRNVAVKEPGPGGVKLTPAAATGSGPAAIGPAAAIGPNDDSGTTNGRKALSIKSSGDRAQRHQRAQGPLHQPQRHQRAQGPHQQAHRANSEATRGPSSRPEIRQ